MPNKRITWFCVADAGTARIKRQSTLRGPLESVATLNRTYEQGRYEEPGKVHESATTARHAFQDAEGPIRREKREFAADVAEFIDAAAQRGAFHRLVLAAPPKFLGDLRAALGAKAKGLVTGEIPKDLTKESDADLAARVADLAA